MLDQLIPGADPDLVRPLAKRITGRYTDVLTSTRVEGVRAQKNGLKVEIGGVGSKLFDRVLVAVGRVPNGRAIDAAAAGVTVDERGFIPVDDQMKTNVPGSTRSATSSAGRCSPTRPPTRARSPPR